MIATAIGDTIKLLTDAKKRVILFLDVPTLEFHPKDCMACVVPTPKNSFIEDEFVRLAASTNNPSLVSVFNPRDVLCDRDGCRAVRDGYILYRDTNHLGKQGSGWLATHYHFPSVHRR